MGATCHAWIHQGDALEKRTLASVKDTPFSKLRMRVFPKDDIYDRNEPVCFPSERAATSGLDLARLSPVFFQHLA